MTIRAKPRTPEPSPALSNARGWALNAHEARVIIAMRAGRDALLDGLKKQLAQTQDELEILRREYQVLEAWNDLLIAALLQHKVPVPEYPNTQIPY